MQIDKKISKAILMGFAFMSSASWCMDNPDNVPQDNQGRPQVLSHNDEMALKVAYLIARADPGVRNFDLIKYGKSTKTNDTWCECLKRLLGL